jgi:D-alanyl-D-alanine carboxypeptidase (penicillin-binding protein 5/6)
MTTKYLKYIFLVTLIINTSLVEAKHHKKSKTNVIITPVQTSLVVDAKTGKVLHHQNSKVKIYPASLTKIMTLYMAFSAIESGKLSMDKKLYVSSNAEKMRPLKLGLKAGEAITVRDAILGLIVKSANDASVVIAESIAGSEKNFARLMTIRARQLGMKDTTFKNASGWHDPEQKTTAVDLAKLSIAIRRDYPQFYPLFAKTNFTFRGNIIHGHNKVTENYAGAEGLKTGYTIPAGCNIVTVASRKNKSLIGIVTGGRSAVSRNQKVVQLLDKHFGVTPVVKDKKKSVIVKVASNVKQKKRIARS